MKTISNLLAGICFFTVFACSSTHKPEGVDLVKMTVNHYRVPCTQMRTQLCYVVKSENQSDWEYLYEGIEGFDYEWGKVYELEVERTYSSGTKSDPSIPKYRLSRVISATNVAANQSFPLVIKNVNMMAIRKDKSGQLSLMGKYPLRCISPDLYRELEQVLQSQPKIISLVRHSADHQSLVLQSLLN
jgi:hypothetical protein